MKTFVQITSIGLLLLSFTACRNATATGKAEQENPDQNVSFDFPPGWEQQAVPGQTVKFVIGPASKEFAPNINVVSEPYDGTLDEYAKLTVEQLPKTTPGIKILKQDKFKTANGLDCIRLITENQQGASKLRQTCFLFDNGAKKYVITCSALAEGGEKLDPVFEASMKTFKFKKK